MSDQTATTARLQRLVKADAFEWGDNVAQAYHAVAGADMAEQWERLIDPVMTAHTFDLSRTMDFAGGRGRNTIELKRIGAQHVTMVDVNPENIASCKVELEAIRGVFVALNNGYDLRVFEDASFTHIHTFDAMVHFDMELVIAYVAEFARILRSGGTALVHHSNYTGNPGGDFKDNPDWRNFMSALIFKHIALRAGFNVLDQQIIPWHSQDIDCISVLRKR